ncbi:MAG: hypothetical protein ACI91B_004250, partial [Planctomycetota bacterium]
SDPLKEATVESRKICLPAAFMAIALLVLSTACSDPDDLSDGTISLPPSLSELSGMVAVDEHTLACVQDELGVVFFVDLQGKKPIRSVSFGKDGDYEGIAAKDDALWVLRSDGTLQELVWVSERLVSKHTYKLPFEGEFEGLCVDAAGEHLLVLPKGPIDGKRREKKRRRILAFHLLLRTGLKQPVVTLKVNDIEDQIEERDLPGPRRTTAKGNRKVDLALYGSELLALPGGDFLMLSPKDRLLLRLKSDGNVVATQGLDMNLLPQPEAMALMPDGRLLIGSEGRDGPARIAVVAIPQ